MGHRLLEALDEARAENRLRKRLGKQGLKRSDPHPTTAFRTDQDMVKGSDDLLRPTGAAMPIYEFYCRDCHTVYSFFTPRMDTERQPACPRCELQDLERKPSRFATLKHRGEEDGEDPFAGLDESRLEGAMGADIAGN